MRAAPAVQLDVETGRGWRWALCALLLLAGLSAAAWAAASGSALAWFVAGLVLVYAAALTRACRVPGRARLAWDGAAWTLLAPGDTAAQRGAVEVRLDLGDALLLRFVPDTGTRRRGRWLPLQRSTVAPAWHALRCALYSPRPLTTGEPG
jgi:hypothetical protein